MKRNWKTIKIILINWTIFAWISMIVAMVLGYRQYQVLQVITRACKVDWERLGSKIEKGEVVVKSEQTLKIDRQGMEVKK